mmetsp:Transcript_44264/g.139646  ORF Transcript_44264/g.139646 Transcript_44264/m.139646 type:complete len:212 (+) Transcript_44264:323-958(+)
MTFSGLRTAKGLLPSVMGRTRLDVSSCGIPEAALERLRDTARRFSLVISSLSSPSRSLQHQRISRLRCWMDLPSSLPRLSRTIPNSSTVSDIRPMAPNIAPLDPTCLVSSMIVHRAQRSGSLRDTREPSTRAPGRQTLPRLSQPPQTKLSLCGMPTHTRTSELGALEEQSPRLRTCRLGSRGFPTATRSSRCPSEEILPTLTQPHLEPSVG